MGSSTRSSAAALDRGRSGFDIVVAEHGQQDARSRLFLWHVNSSEARKFAAKPASVQNSLGTATLCFTSEAFSLESRQG